MGRTFDQCLKTQNYGFDFCQGKDGCSLLTCTVIFVIIGSGLPVFQCLLVKRYCSSGVTNVVQCILEEIIRNSLSC